MTLVEFRATLSRVLSRSTRKAGLTYGEAGKKCGKQWRDSLPKHSGLPVKRSISAHLTKFIYDEWRDGRLFLEPPRPGQRSARIWHPEHAAKKFARAATSTTVQSNGNGASAAQLRQAYEHFLPEHPSGAVNIFKIRRFLDWSRDGFDSFVESLACQRNPPFQFVGGDPQAYSADQREDSLEQQGELYFSILWRN